MNFVLTLLSLIPFYLIGATPSGYLLGRAQGIDVTKSGSGNVGATNLARTVGKKAGLYTLLIDITKGAVAVLIATLVQPAAYFVGLAGLAAVCGHCFSIPGKLKGGKGVATALGTLLVLIPIPSLLTILIFSVVFTFTRTVSTSSVSAALSAPIVAMLFQVPQGIVMAVAGIGIVITYRHKENLRRLVEGNEPKFEFKKPQSS